MSLIKKTEQLATITMLFITITLKNYDNCFDY